MKYRKQINLGLAIISFILIVILAINAIIDHMATDMLSGVVVMIGLGAIFIASYIGWILDSKA